MTETLIKQAIKKQHDTKQVTEQDIKQEVNALCTEAVNRQYADLDQLSNPDLIKAFISDQQQAALAVMEAAPQIEQALAAMFERVKQGGRLIYVGAGTSGRLGLLDSVELNPTFSWPREKSLGLLAGGNEAIIQAVEGAEDDRQLGIDTLREHNIQGNDMVLAIAASGRTPYCIGALQEARRVGALAIAISNNPSALLSTEADIAIELNTGAEVISGSTRLKAGTAQKIVLNTLSSSLMVKLNKVYGNLMVDVKASNEKLKVRATRLVMRVTGIDQLDADILLKACDYQVKTAIVAAKCSINIEQARERLTRVDGNVRLSLAC